MSIRAGGRVVQATARKRPAAKKPLKRKSRGKRYGCEVPRLWSKPLRPLTPLTSAGFGAIAFADGLYERVQGTPAAELVPKLLPWQRWFLIHALELLADGSFRFKTVLLLVARQNGKTFLSAILILWRMFLDQDAKVLGVADKASVSQEVWEYVRQIIDAVPELSSELEGSPSKSKGDIYFDLTKYRRYRIASTTDGGARGHTFTLIVFDELRQQKTWDGWSAISKTRNAQRRSQLYGFSNAGDARAIVLRHFRDTALASLEAGDDENAIGLFEWSAPDDMPTSDRDGWYMANPSLGHTITEAQLAADQASDPEWVFRTEVLNQWVSTAVGGIFGAGKWNDARDPLSKRAPGAPVYICVEVSYDRTYSHIGFATMREDGLAHVGIMASRPGPDWVVPWLQSPDRKFTPAAITFQTRGAPVSSLTGAFSAAGIDVTEWGGPDLGRATGLILDAVNGDKVRHRDQPVLDVAAMTAVLKKLADGQVIDRANSPGDGSPISAVAGAYWLMMNPPEEKPEPRIRTVGG